MRAVWQRMEDDIIEFEMMFAKNAIGGCWIWKGRLNKGYGRFRRVGAHRYSYLHYIGPIPDGLTVDHLCFNTACVNPAHMELVTPSENSRRQSVYRKANGLPQGPPRLRECDVEGCNNSYSGGGYCKYHYERWRKYGDPLFFKIGPRMKTISLNTVPIRGTLHRRASTKGGGK